MNLLEPNPYARHLRLQGCWTAAPRGQAWPREWKSVHNGNSKPLSNSSLNKWLWSRLRLLNRENRQAVLSDTLALLQKEETGIFNNKVKKKKQEQPGWRQPCPTGGQLLPVISWRPLQPTAWVLEAHSATDSKYPMKLLMNVSKTLVLLLLLLCCCCFSTLT